MGAFVCAHSSLSCHRQLKLPVSSSKAASGCTPLRDLADAIRWACHVQEEIMYLDWPEELLKVCACMPSRVARCTVCQTTSPNCQCGSNECLQTLAISGVIQKQLISTASLVGFTTWMYLLW